LKIINSKKEWEKFLAEVLLSEIDTYSLFNPKEYPVMVFYDLDTYTYRNRQYRYASVFYSEDHARIFRYLTEIKRGKKYPFKLKLLSYDPVLRNRKRKYNHNKKS